MVFGPGAVEEVLHAVVRHVLHENDEVVAVQFGQVGGGANGGCQGVEFGEIAHLPLVEVVAHGDPAVGRVLRRVLGDERSRRTVHRAFVGGREPRQFAHHAHAFTDLAGCESGDGDIVGQDAVLPQCRGQPLGGDALGHGW